MVWAFRLIQSISTHPYWQVLQPHGIRVVIECTHMCMSMRGVEQPRAITTTRAELGSLPAEGCASSSGMCQPCARL